MGRRELRRARSGCAGMFDRDGKHTSQEAKSRREVQTVLRVRDSSSTPCPNASADGSGRSIRRQLFDLRTYANANAQASRRAQLQQLADVGAPRSCVAVGPLRAVSRRRHAAATPVGFVPTLQSLCARRVAEDLQFWGTEELGWLPSSVRADVMLWASLVSLRREARSGRRSGIVTDADLAALIDPSMSALSVSCSRVTDACVDLLEPKLELTDDVGEYAGECWDDDAHLDGLRVTGMQRLLKLDLSFCSELTETVVDKIADACPALQTLSLAGDFNTEDSSYFVARALCRHGRFRFLRVLDLSCCSWLSFELLVQSKFLSPEGTTSMESLEELHAESCPDFARVVEHEDIVILNPYSTYSEELGGGIIDAVAHLARRGAEGTRVGVSESASVAGEGGLDAELLGGVALLLSRFHVCRMCEPGGGVQWMTLLRGVRAPKRRVLRIVTSWT